MRRSSTRASFFTAVGLMVCSDLWAFKPGIHQDVCSDGMQPISRTVGGETLKFTDKALVQVRKADADTDSISFGFGPFFDSFKHFDAESFPAASQRLIDLKTSVISKITAASPDGKAAREDLGTALHTLQDFYAHSNWVEIGSSGIFNSLGRSALAMPAASKAFCPTDPGTLAGVGLTELTTGYYFGLTGCGAPPAGKCHHGGFNCAARQGDKGINKDDLSRTNHTAARGFGRDNTADYVNMILDSTGVAGNAKAIKALMGIKGTLGMVIDDTGSMGPSINQVKAQVATIVNSVAGTDDEPDEYLLESFNDPDVGTPLITTDATAFLAAVNALTPHGGGDCPELCQTGLLRAASASKSDSNLFLFTDASSKDASLGSAVDAKAQEKRIKITALLSGTCSPVDPTYIRNAEETGGQLFLLNPFELGGAFDLVKPQLSGDFVTLFQTRGTLLSGSPRSFAVPVDSTIARVVFSLSVDVKGPTTLLKPSGTPVLPGQPGVTFKELSSGTVITVERPEPGAWNWQIAGSGSFSVAVKGNSPIELYLFDFVELISLPDHGFERINGQPVAGSVPTGLANMVGRFASASFRLVDEAGATLLSLTLARGHPEAAADEFVGDIPLPGQPFRIVVSGLDNNGFPYQRVFPALFRGQTVKVSLDPTSAVPSLPAGRTTTLRFNVSNLGGVATFQIVAADNKGFVSRVQPTLLTLGAGGSGVVQVDLSVPAATPPATVVSLVTTATSTADPTITNSTSITLPVTTNRPPDCTRAAPSVASLRPPNHRMVDVAITGVTDPDGDPVTVRIDRILQDEPVMGVGDGDTCPDGQGVGTATARLRAERSGSGNGRVYTVFFTASDGKGGSCQGSVNVCVPHDQGRDDSCVDDGPRFDSTVCP